MRVHVLVEEHVDDVQRQRVAGSYLRQEARQRRVSRVTSAPVQGDPQYPFAPAEEGIIGLNSPRGLEASCDPGVESAFQPGGDARVQRLVGVGLPGFAAMTQRYKGLVGPVVRSVLHLRRLGKAARAARPSRWGQIRAMFDMLAWYTVGQLFGGRLGVESERSCAAPLASVRVGPFRPAEAEVASSNLAGRTIFQDSKKAPEPPVRFGGAFAVASRVHRVARRLQTPVEVFPQRV